MGRNAQANQNLCMAIGLQLKEDEFVPANQVGDRILCAELIELRVDDADNAIVLTKNKIKKFRSILKGTHCPRLEGKSDKEQNLLIKLEKLEDLVEYQEVEINELEGDIQDFCCDLHEANEDIFESIVMNEIKFLSKHTYNHITHSSQSHIYSLIVCRIHDKEQ